MDPFLDEEPRSGGGFDPYSLLRMFWRRKWLFFVPFILCLAMAAVAIRTMTPIYESMSQIRVIHERATSDLIEDDFRRIRARDLDRETLATIWTIATSPKFLESVVRQTRLYQGMARLPEGGGEVLPEVLTPEEMENVERQAARLSQRIRVRQDGHHIFAVGIRDTDPRQAFVLARVMLDRFLEEERAARMASRTSTRDFLSRQRGTYVEALQVAEDSLTSYSRGLVTGTEAGNPVNAGNVVQAEASLLRLQNSYYNSDVNEMDWLETQARTAVGALPDVDSIMRDRAVTSVLQHLRDLEYDRLLNQGDSAISAESGQARMQLNDLVGARVSLAYPQIGVMDLERLTRYVYFMIYREAKGRALEDLARYIRDYRDFTERQPQQSARLAKLEEQVAQRREMLDDIDRNLAQLDINLEARRSEIGYRVEVRRDPKQSRIPVEPDKMKLYFMGFVLSLAIGFGLVVLSVMLDRTFTSVAEIERSLGLTVIGTLPVIQDEHFKRKRHLRLMRWIVLVVLILGVAAVFLLYIYPRLS